MEDSEANLNLNQESRLMKPNKIVSFRDSNFNPPLHRDSSTISGLDDSSNSKETMRKSMKLELKLGEGSGDEEKTIFERVNGINTKIFTFQ